MSKLDAVYDHNKYEKKWWDFWIQGGWFEANVDHSKTPYTVIIPPPNVTSQLHMGHALNITVQDMLIRRKRMQGFNACWLPGTDHAGIATQMMVEKSLEANGESRVGLGRKAFVQRCMDWKEKYGGTIVQQTKQMGASCDWRREAYTMDETLSKAVRKIFVDLYNDGLIYRGERLVNWCPVLKTAISDDEIETKEVNGTLWHYKYPVKDSDEFVTIATTRPETMLGDTAIAINPDDERYQHLKGKTVIIPFAEREIPIVFDEYVKSEYGTGCVKVTPAHDPNDFEIGKRHNLPMINIFNKDGSLNENTPEPFRGLDRFVARKALIKALKEKGLFEKEVANKHAVPYSDRGKQPIEPMISKQWFVKMKELAGPAIEAVRSGELTLHPDTFKNTYFHWMENIQDWCISRQIWWGHQIPIWYCGDCNQTTTGMEDPTACGHCQSKNITQDEDVLDTWFSSWLWPLSPFGWPEETEDLNYFYPSNILSTAPEIIFLWVARMVMAGYYTRKKLCFKDVYFHSTICDKNGMKFSKTLGNGIDPLDVIAKYGADSARFTCVSLAPNGGRVKMAFEDFEGGSKFVNKIWNAARFLLTKLEPIEKIPAINTSALELPEKWLLHELAQATQKINSLLDRYAINEAIDASFLLAWRTFCDWGLESAKPALDGTDLTKRDNAASVLLYAFETVLRILAPIMPFVTEEIWQALPHHPEWDRPASLVVAKFPDFDVMHKFPVEAKQWESIQDFITGVRSVRMQAGVPPKEKVDVFVKCDKDLSDLIASSTLWISKLGNVQTLQAGLEIVKPEKSMINVGKGYEAYIPVGAYLDFDKEKTRLTNEINRIEKIVVGLRNKLSNKDFVDRAPGDIVEQTKAQLGNMESQLEGLNKNLASI